VLAILILAQAVTATPSAVPDEGPPPPSIVERIGAPAPGPAAVPTPSPPATPTARAAATVAPPTPIPKVVPVAAPAPTALPVQAATPKAAAAHGNAFGVHVGSYRKRTTAEGEALRLGAQFGLPARVLQVDLGAKGVWYRVVVGEAGSAAEASALRERLKQKGISDGLVQRF